MSELKSCPFCGEKAEVVISWVYNTYSVTCTSEEQCMGINQEQDEQGGYACELGTVEQAIEAWNARDSLT